MTEKNTKTYWCGFVGGKPSTAFYFNRSNKSDYPSLFTNKKKAKSYFEDVRKVKIVEVKP